MEARIRTCSNLINLRVLGFEPKKALSYQVLSLTRLTTPAHPRNKIKCGWVLKLTDLMINSNLKRIDYLDMENGYLEFGGGYV